MSNYKVIINHYTDSEIGHFNVTLVDTTGLLISGIEVPLAANGTQLTLGQNLSQTESQWTFFNALNGGLNIENDKLENFIDGSAGTPSNTLWRSEEISVTVEQFQQIVDFSKARLHQNDIGLGIYNVNGHNCFNYADAILKLAGGDEYVSGLNYSRASELGSNYSFEQIGDIDWSLVQPHAVALDMEERIAETTKNLVGYQGGIDEWLNSLPPATGILDPVYKQTFGNTTIIVSDSGGGQFTIAVVDNSSLLFPTRENITVTPKVGGIITHSAQSTTVDNNGNANTSIIEYPELDANGNPLGSFEYSTFTRDAQGNPHIDGISLVQGDVPSTVEKLEWAVTVNPLATNLEDLLNFYEVTGFEYDSLGNVVLNPDGTQKIITYASSNDLMSADLRSVVAQNLAQTVLMGSKFGWISLPAAITENPNFATAIEGAPDSFHVVKFADGTVGISMSRDDTGAERRMTFGLDNNGNNFTSVTTKLDGVDVVTTTTETGPSTTTESTEVFIGGTNIGLGTVGSMFGSSLSSLVSPNNALENVAVSTVFGLVGKELFQFAGAAVGGKSFNASIDVALGDIGNDLKLAGVGAIPSFLTAELFNALSIDGVGGELLSTSGGFAVSTIADNLAHLGEIVQVNGVDITIEWDTNLSFAQFGNIIGSYLGSKLASQIISFDTLGGQIGASLGAGAGSFFAGKAIGNLIGKLGGLGGPLGFAVGAFVGYILGGLLGSLFGGTPRSAADVLFNPDTGEFGVGNVWSKKGGSTAGARQLASIAAANLNGILAAIGGTVVNEGRLSGGTYGLRKSDYTYRVDGGSYGPGDPGKQTISRTFDGDDPDATTLLIEHGVLNALDDLEISGGDVFLKRALYGSLDTLMSGSNVLSSIQGEAINVILGNFQTAADYRTYIENAATINALIAAEPESAFTAGWIITLQRVSEIGLNKRHTSDWLGGYQAWAVTNDVQSLGALSLNPFINGAGQSDRRFILTDQNGFTRRIYDTVTQSSKDVISGTLGADVMTITDDLLTGNLALTINGVVSDGSDFGIDIAATVRGGDGDDVITGGDLGNDLFGDGGNDVITGGLKDDWIFGGTGNDKLYAGGGDGNYLSGDGGNDELYGATGSDWLEGGSGIDILHGNGGDDVLSGGAGAGDQLLGGSGDDAYILRLGDGADIIDDKADDPVAAPTQSIKSIIEDRTSGILARNWAGIEQLSFAGSDFVESGRISGGQDTLIMGAGIGLGDITIARSVGGGGALGNDLIVKVLVNGVLTGDQVTLTNWFDDYSRIEKLEFADGQVINIGNFATFTLGTDGADYIIGTAGNDFVHGGSGDDVIFLLWGNDVGIGGLGNDFLSGDQGQDIVIGGDDNDNVNGGDGNDTVQGGRHDDQLFGGADNDVLSGDQLTVNGANDNELEWRRAA